MLERGHKDKGDSSYEEGMEGPYRRWLPYTSQWLEAQCLVSSMSVSKSAPQSQPS